MGNISMEVRCILEDTVVHHARLHTHYISIEICSNSNSDASFASRPHAYIHEQWLSPRCGCRREDRILARDICTRSPCPHSQAFHRPNTGRYGGNIQFGASQVRPRRRPRTLMGSARTGSWPSCKDTQPSQKETNSPCQHQSDHETHQGIHSAMARDIRMTQNQNSTLKQQASNISTVKNLATKMWKIRTPYDPSGTTRSRTRPP